MGARRSGNWDPRCSRKWSVEESFAVDMREFRPAIYLNSVGTYTWAGDAGEVEQSVGFSISTGGPGLMVTIQYRWHDQEDVCIPVRLQTTPTNFDGRRWWFTCPLIVGGVACNRRVGKLYLPPGARYFGCRNCHDLTYRSCQETRRTRHRPLAA